MVLVVTVVVVPVVRLVVLLSLVVDMDVVLVPVVAEVLLAVVEVFVAAAAVAHQRPLQALSQRHFPAALHQPSARWSFVQVPLPWPSLLPQ